MVAMVKLYIDGREVSVEEGRPIAWAAAMAGVKVPRLCAFPGLNDIGACRVCVVEVEGQERLVTACNTPVTEGMRVLTNTRKVRRARRTNVELILSQHNTSCTSCVRSGNCALQDVACELNILDVPYPVSFEREPWNASFPLIRDSSKCVRCFRCVQVCDNVQGIHVWGVKNRATRTTIGVNPAAAADAAAGAALYGEGAAAACAEGARNLTIDATKCVACGQCITHCPVGALRARDDTDRVWDAIADPDTVTIVQVAPAVRAAWGEQLGLTREQATPGKMAAALRSLGFDYVFDTNFGADLTIMEEANEFLERLAHKDEYEFPMFTSCCPGWVRYMKGHHPDKAGMLSTSKSPHEMLGATAKALLQKREGIDSRRVFVVSIMPCVAKKYECAVPQLSSVVPEGAAGAAGAAAAGAGAAGAVPDVDASLTTREFVRMLKEEQVIPALLEEDHFDSPLGEGTGAAVIFGATGGVMEAALRTAAFAVTGQNPDPDAFRNVRGMDGWKEETFDLAGTPLRVAVASGLANTERLLAAIDAGEVSYDFVEVMACPGGCVGGGGQPIRDGVEQADVRSDVLYKLDTEAHTRFSHENAEVQAVYDTFYGKPLSELAEALLHTDQAAWDF